MRSLKFIVFAAMAASLSGCDLFTADIEEPSVCETFPDQTFPGIPPLPVFPLDLTQQFTENLSDLPVNNDNTTKTEARVITVDFTAKSGANDLNFIDRARITILPPDGSTLPRKQVIDYTRVGNAGRTIHLVPADTTGNLLDYLKSKRLKIEAQITLNSLPSNNWTLDVKACLWLKATVKYFQVKSAP